MTWLGYGRRGTTRASPPERRGVPGSPVRAGAVDRLARRCRRGVALSANAPLARGRRRAVLLEDPPFTRRGVREPSSPSPWKTTRFDELVNGYGTASRPPPIKRLADEVVDARPPSLGEVLAKLAQHERLAGAAPLVDRLVGALALPPRRLADRQLTAGRLQRRGHARQPRTDPARAVRPRRTGVPAPPRRARAAVLSPRGAALADAREAGGPARPGRAHLGPRPPGAGRLPAGAGRDGAAAEALAVDRDDAANGGDCVDPWTARQPNSPNSSPPAT